MKVVRAGIAAALALVVALPMAHAADAKPDIKNLKHNGQIKFKGGTELAASGKYVYAGEMNGEFDRNEDPNKGGLHIIDVSGKRPREVGFLHCPGTDNDVEVVKPGLVVMAFSTNRCAPTAGVGLMTVDVTNPRKPKVLGSLNTNKAHTLKPIPGTTLVYMASGGLTGGPNAGPAIVDVKNPQKPKLVGSGKTYTMDCHDISFHVTKKSKLAFCAGAVGTGEVTIFDIKDPKNPTIVSKIVNPAIQYSHYAIASSDGKYLAIDDEAFAAHECVSGQSPTGRVWIYDISNPVTPILHSSFAAKRGDPGVGTLQGWVPSWCLSHGLDWQPGKHNLAVTWFTGGVSVLSVGDQAVQPEEIAWFKADDSATYSALWHAGKLYTNDMARGVDSFTLKK